MLFRVFGSEFLSHQGAVTEVQLLGEVDPISMMEHSLDTRVELYQQNNVSMGIQVKKQKQFVLNLICNFRQMSQNLSEPKMSMRTN